MALLIVALPLAALAASCADSLPPPVLDDGCALDSDCPAALVCAFQVCHEQCGSSRDCPSGERCVRGPQSGNVCQLASEKYCEYTSQCPTREVCAVDGQCRDQCLTQRDCVSGQVCTQGVCADPSELGPSGLLPGVRDGGVGQTCQLTSDCGDAGLVCRQGACAVQCVGDVDCQPPTGPGGACVEGTCVLPALSDGGADGSIDAGFDAAPDAVTDAASDAPLGYGRTCNLPSDCPMPLKCGLAGQCVYACDTDEDCASGECCFEHSCQMAGTCAVPDGGDAGGAGDGGDGGDGGAVTCAMKCVADADCSGGTFCNPPICVANCCAPSPTTVCDSHNACSLDTCDEATKSCTHTSLGPVDADGDGYLSIACGGHDCDDNDPTVYPGATEYYDGKDNDCNGFIDDWTAEPKGQTSPVLQISGAITGSPLAQVCGAVGAGPGAWICGFVEQGGGPTVGGVAPFDSTWTEQTAMALPLPGGEVALDAASGPGTFAMALVGGGLSLAVVKADGTGVGVPLLDATFTHDANEGVQVTWTGQDYLVGWYGVGAIGYFALVDVNANMLGVQLLPGGTTVASAVAPASNGTSLAVAYTVSNTNAAYLLVLAPDGSPAQPAVPLGPAIVLAAAGTPTGYVVLAYSSFDGVFTVGVPVSGGVPGTASKPNILAAVPTGTLTNARGASDGVGAAFLMEYPSGVWFGYQSGVNPKNPFELIEVGAGTTIADIAGGVGGRLGLFYGTPSGIYGRQAGFASLQGAFCAQSSNCASGACTPKVVGGPKAYSVCE
jgi:hypothetical protein